MAAGVALLVGGASGAAAQGAEPMTRVVDTLAASCPGVDLAARRCAVGTIARRLRGWTAAGVELTWSPTASAFLAADPDTVAIPALLRYVARGDSVLAVAIIARDVPTRRVIPRTAPPTPAPAAPAPLAPVVAAPEGAPVRLDGLADADAAEGTLRPAAAAPAPGGPVTADSIARPGGVLAPRRAAADQPAVVAPVRVADPVDAARPGVVEVPWPGDPSGRAAVSCRVTAGAGYRPLAPRRGDGAGCRLQVAGDASDTAVVVVTRGPQALAVRVHTRVVPSFGVRALPGTTCAAVVARVEDRLRVRGVRVVPGDEAGRVAVLTACQDLARLRVPRAGTVPPAGLVVRGELVERGSDRLDAVGRGTGLFVVDAVQPGRDPLTDAAEAIVLRLLRYVAP